MSHIDGLFLGAKVAVIGAATVPASVYVVPMWGAMPASFLLAGIGASLSYTWFEREDNGLKLIGKTLTVTLFAVSMVVFVPDFADWNLEPKSEPPLAFLIALFGRLMIPAIKKVLPSIARGFAGMFNRNTGYQDNGPPYYKDTREHDDPRYPPKNPSDPKDQDSGY